MSETDATYYRRRAEAEAEQAAQATSPDTARIHSELADAYRQRAASAIAGDRVRHA